MCATQSTDHSTVRARYFPRGFLAALVAFNLALLSPFHLLLTTPVSHTDKTGGCITKNPHLSQEEHPKSVLPIPKACMAVL